MPGMCVKTSSVSEKQKVFLNICQSQAVPPPPPLSQEALVKLLDSEDPTSYRVPMSLGEPHTEVDNSKRHVHIFKFTPFSFNYWFPLSNRKIYCFNARAFVVWSDWHKASLTMNDKTTTLICDNPSLPSFYDKAFDLNSEYFYVCQAHKAVLYMMSWSMMSSSRNVRYVSWMWMYTLKVPQEYATAFIV